MLDPTKRFSNRVENYLKYRPRYPAEIIALLEKDCALTRDSVIADVGSGTGFLSELFLRNGNRVLGVEPNAEMRAAGERLLADYPNFLSVDATAEATTLSDSSVDFITAGQAFHWFDREKTYREFQRILKTGGWVVIVWNTFPTGRSALVKAYDDVLVRYGTDYREVASEIENSGIQTFFPPGQYQRARFDFQQTFDWKGFQGRLLSASYAPNADSANYEPMLGDLRRVFDSHQKDGAVVFDYDTVVYYGRLNR
ncbi:MAG TPA: class I SAM-dependent methyltransferase [Pyrinomonadaceae bacterium]|nr:class I SAM-dependent methyltransferase [Pyrinomonadaceae bacterium]